MDSAKTVRVLHVVVQPVLLLDDGAELKPGPQINPVTVCLSELPALAAEIAAAVQDIQAKIGQAAADAEPPLNP